MTWVYQMNLETVKESHRVLWKIKGTPARRIYYMRLVIVFLIPLLICIIKPVIEGTFTPRYHLLLLVFTSLLMMFFFRRAHHRLYANQLPARYSLTVKDGFLAEEIIARDGTMSSSKKPLREVLQVMPLRKGLFIQLSGSSCLFLPEAAFRQITVQESVSFLLEAVAMCKNEIPAASHDFPESVEDCPEYGTVYFDLPSSHIYSLYIQSILHLYRNPLRFLRITFRNSWKPLTVLGLFLLLGGLLHPRLLLLCLLSCLIFAAAIYALNLLLVIWKYYVMEKKNRLTAHCGPQHLSLYENHLLLRRQEHTYQYYYHAFYGLYETKEAFYLLMKNPVSILLIPKWAFNSSQEEALFVRNLQGKISATKRH